MTIGARPKSSSTRAKGTWRKGRRDNQGERQMVNIPNYTLAEAEARLSGRELRRFVFAWTWSAPRFGGRADLQQTRYYARHGQAHYRARMNQVRRILGVTGD